MSNTPSTTLSTGRATSQTGNKASLDKLKKVLPDWDKTKKATIESHKILQIMDSHYNKLVKIIDGMPYGDTRADLMDHLLFLQEMLNILYNAPTKMTIAQFKASLTVKVAAGEVDEKAKSKALENGDQNAILKSKPEQESKSTRKPQAKPASVFSPKPNNIRMVTKRVSPPTKKAVSTTQKAERTTNETESTPKKVEHTTKKAEPTKKIPTKPRPSNKQIDAPFEDSKEDSDPVASGRKQKAEKSEAAVVERAPLELDADSTKYEPEEYISITSTSSDKAEKKPASTEMSAEPASPSAHSELEKKPVVVTADTKKDKGAQPDSSEYKPVALIAGGRKARRTFGMPGVAIPVPKTKKKDQGKPAKEPVYDDDSSDSDSETKKEKKSSDGSTKKEKKSDDEAVKTADKVEEAEKDNGSKEAEVDSNGQEKTDEATEVESNITEKYGKEKPLAVDDEKDEAVASSEEGKSTQLPATPDTDTAQANVQNPKADSKVKGGHGSKETGAGSAPRDHSRQAATKSGSKRKHADDHNTLPSKRPAIEGRNIASPRTHRPAPAAALADMIDIDSALTRAAFAPCSFAPAMVDDDDDEL